MCGIFGNSTRAKYRTLYNLNAERGNFSYGQLEQSCLDTTSFRIDKIKGVVPDEKELPLSRSAGIVLGHTQAPTSSQREWSEDTSHPFTVGNWTVAHNGIISNFEKLKRSYVDISHTNPVDSSIIPALLDLFENKGIKGHETLVIKVALELLQGTFACWIHNKRSTNIYLVRCASTLFTDGYGIFSSVKVGDSVVDPIPEGVIFKVLPGELKKTAEFKYNSPFFTL